MDTSSSNPGATRSRLPAAAVISDTGKRSSQVGGNEVGAPKNFFDHLVHFSIIVSATVAITLLDSTNQGTRRDLTRVLRIIEGSDTCRN